MNVMILFLAVVVAICVWWFVLQQLTAKPWLESGVDDAHDGAAFRVVSAKLGLWVFLAVVTSLFCLFATAYMMRMHLGGWQPLPEPRILLLNSGLMVASSIAMQLSVRATSGGRGRRATLWLALGGGLAILFILGQCLAWRQLQNSGYTISANPANGFFYLLTAVHGIHLVGGLWVWSRTMFKLGGGASPAEVGVRIQLCAQYWHYLLLVWLLLYALLLTT